MSLNVAGLTAYVDETRMQLIKKMILGGRSTQFLTIQPDIKSTASINLLSSTLVAQGGGCGFSNSGTTNLTQNDLQVCPLKVNESICLDTLEQYYTQTLMQPGSYNTQIPFEQLYVEEKTEQISALIDDLVWRGNTATGVGNLDLYLYCGYDFYRTYATALRNANLFHYTGAEDQGQQFSQMVPGTNVRMIAVRGLNTSNKFFISSKSNMFFGTDLLNDYENFELWYSLDNQEVRMAAKWKLGVNAAFWDYVVYFKL